MNIQTQFYNVVNNSNLYEAELLIKNINVQDNSNIYLITAVNRTDDQMLELLLNHGADPVARNGLALTTAASKYDAKCLKILLPHFTDQKWDALLDATLQKVVEHHKTFQTNDAVKVCAPYASQNACNRMMVHAVLSHRSLIIPVLASYINPTVVLDLLAQPQYSSRLNEHHTQALEALKHQEAVAQKQRIEEHLPAASSSATRKL